MNIVYYIDKDKEQYWNMLAWSAMSVSKNVAFPHIILQTTQEILDKYHNHIDSQAHYSISMMHETIEIDPRYTQYPYWYNRILMNARMRNTQCLFIDVDTLVLQDVSQVFYYYEQARVLAATRYPLETGLPKLNWGVSFSQSDGFWKQLAEVISPTGKDPELRLNQEYNKYLKTNEGHYGVLDGSIYNRQVNSMQELFDHEIKILHFKGQRKQYMEYYYNKLILGKEGDKDVDKDTKVSASQYLIGD